MTKPKKRRTQREMFEAWISRDGEDLFMLDRSRRSGEYYADQSRYGWQAWQAAVRANRRKRT